LLGVLSHGPNQEDVKMPNATRRLLDLPWVMIVLLLFTAVSAVSASEYRDAKRAYEAGEYDLAVQLLAEQLREKPKHKDAANLMLTVLPVAYQQHQAAADDAELRQDWDVQVVQLRAVQKLTNDVRTLPPVPHPKSKEPIAWQVVDVAPKLRATIQTAAQAHYDAGIRAMDGAQGTLAAREFQAALALVPGFSDAREQGAEALYREGVAHKSANRPKEAAVAFRGAQGFVSGYKDAAKEYAACREAAIRRIAVMPFENVSGKQHLGALGDMLADQVLAKSMARKPEFVDFVNRTQLEALLAEKGQQQVGIVDAGTAVSLGKLANVHAFVFGKILAITENFPGDQAGPQQSNSIEWKNYNTGEVSVLTATFRLMTREGAVEVVASLNIVEGGTGRILSAEQLQERAADVAKWVVFTGDERAVPSWITSDQTPGGQRPLKPAQTMAMESIDRLSSALAGKLNRTFE
jgi:hypothetical protein